MNHDIHKSKKLLAPNISKTKHTDNQVKQYGSY